MFDMRKCLALAVLGLVVAGASALLIENSFAHCDSTRGPLIPEAKAALEKGDVTPMLKWVGKADEAELRSTFARTVTVRAMGGEARELADRYFLETLVRLHRAGEGAPFTGIRDDAVDPVVAMADQALLDGSADPMIGKITGHLAESIREKFEQAARARARRNDSVEAGREFVKAYVTYVRYVEGVDAAIAAAGAHPAGGAGGDAGHRD